MPVVQFGLRVAAVEALKGATLVGDNVRDSDFAAIDIAGDGNLRTNQDRPFIVVYTDEAEVNKADTRDMRQNGTVDFVCEFGAATPMAQTDPETGESVIAGVDIPATDAALEMALDLVDRQIGNALTDPESAWTALWQRLSDRVDKIERKRAVTADNGVRLAARQLRIRLECKPDPVFGQPLAEGAVWTELRAAIAADRPELVSTYDAMLGAEQAEVSIDMIRRAFGQTMGQARRLGYGPRWVEHPDAAVETVETERDGDTT
jgi:hypothetical protein